MSNLLIDARPLIVLPPLAKEIGIERAIILQQFHFVCQQPHSGKTINGKKYIYNTYAEWQRLYFPFWSAKTVQRHILILEKEGLIESIQPLMEEGDATKYYRVNTHHPILRLPHLTSETIPISPVRPSPSHALDHLYKDTETSTETSNKEEEEDSVSSESKILPQRLSPFDFVSVLLTNSRLRERSVRQRLGALANKHGDTLTTLLTNIDWDSVSGERIDYLTAAARNEYLKNETWEEYEARNTDTRTLDERLRAEWYEYEARNTDTRTLNERLEAEWYEYEQSRGLTDNQQMQNGNGLETAVAG